MSNAMSPAPAPRPTVSVVLPNYNHAHCLPNCLRALLEQSLPADEIIVLDDASTDSSVEVIEAFAATHPVIRFYRNDRNHGVVYGMNRGIDLATGDYVLFAAADDEVRHTLFEKSMPLLAANPRAGLSCTIGDWREVTTGMNWHVGVGMSDVPCYFDPRQLLELERQSRLFIASHTAIFRRSALIEAGKFIPELNMHCDWFAMYITAFRYGICFVPEPLGISNIHPRSVYSSGVRAREDYRRVLRRMLELLDQKEYRDVAPPIRESGAMFIFGRPMLGVMLRRRDFRRYLNWTFLRKNLWHTFKVTMKQFTPAFLANLYFRLCGYRARSAQGRS